MMISDDDSDFEIELVMHSHEHSIAWYDDYRHRGHRFSPDVDSRASEKETPIVCRCIQSGYDETAMSLIERGFSISEADRNEMTPLHWSAIRRYKELINVLISKGADVHARDDTAQTPLHLACSKDISGRGSFEIVKALCEANSDLDAVDEYGRTPLMKACTDGEIRIAAYLIDQGASINILDSSGRSALVHAISGNPLPALVDMLLDKGAQTEVENHSGFAPLITFLKGLYLSGAEYDENEEDNCKIVKSLVAAGCNVNKMNSSGDLALCVAAHSKQTELMKILLNSGCNTSLQDNSEKTALFYACRSGHEASVRLILAAGVNKVEETLWLHRKEALEKINDKNLIEICVEKISGVPRLAEICRCVIRRALTPNIESGVEQLKYPTAIMNYLLLNHY